MPALNSCWPSWRGRARTKGSHREVHSRDQVRRGFADAYIGLGRSLLAAERPADAIAPLETAAKLQPDNPTAHFHLAPRIRPTSRKADMDREFLAYKKASEKARQTKDDLKKAVSGSRTEKP